MNFEEWITENKGLIVHMADDYYSPGMPNYIDKDDLIQETVLAVNKAWKNYDEGKGDFLPYVITYIKNHLIKLDETYQGIDHRTTTIAEDYTPSEKPQNWLKEDLFILKRGIKEQLTKRQYDLLTASYGLFDEEKQTYKELGKQRGLTKQRIEQIISSAEDKLKKWLQDHGYGVGCLAKA